jgi:hypothetical protein
MKPTSSHDPLDDLIAAALHGDLTPGERASFETRLQNDPAARAAYQESQLMHDLLEKTHREAQPDPAFEQRMVSGVRRKIQHEEQHRETAWESVVILWRGLRHILIPRRPLLACGTVAVILCVIVGTALGPITSGLKHAPENRLRMLGREQGLADMEKSPQEQQSNGNVAVVASSPGSTATSSFAVPAAPVAAPAGHAAYAANDKAMADTDDSSKFPTVTTQDGTTKSVDSVREFPYPSSAAVPGGGAVAANAPTSPPVVVRSGEQSAVEAVRVFPYPITVTNSGPTSQSPAPAAIPSRKLIRNAQLDLEVKSFQVAVDTITSLVNSGGGYVDTSNSQRGGNGKLQGTIVVKVLPQNLDAFLLKLRDLGEIRNQAVSTDDVTKAYYDTQARLDNARRMETQLQDLLKRDNGKVSELLQVERELGRVRGEIEQMQGELKLYDFQVQYATVTLTVQEKDLTEAAAYLLKERDEFSLFSTNVEATFQQARQAAEDFQAHILNANLNHNSGSDVSAMLVVSVPPEQIEPFLARIRTLGRVQDFTRETERVARDGGETDQPADQARTEKDRVLVHLSVRSDDEARKQVALTVVTPSVDQALDQAKSAALASPGAEILNSSLNKTPEGASTAQVAVRVPGKGYAALLEALRALGRTSSFSLQRDDNSGPNAAGDDAPVIISLSLTDDETPLQQTEMSIVSTDVDATAQQLKKDAATAGIEVKTSSFERQPDGREMAQMTFRLPLGKYPAFVEQLKKLGRVESLTVHREDRPDQAKTDDGAPAEVSLQLHNESEIVAENSGLWATLRQTFGEGAEALFGSVRMIGVLVAFLVPWVLVLGVVAWLGRRIYISRRK